MHLHVVQPAKTNKISSALMAEALVGNVMRVKQHRYGAALTI